MKIIATPTRYKWADVLEAMDSSRRTESGDNSAYHHFSLLVAMKLRHCEIALLSCTPKTFCETLTSRPICSEQRRRVQVSTEKKMASGVSYEDVSAVCGQLVASGKNPTYLQVHEVLQRGSTRVVTAYIKTWREQHAAAKSLESDPIFSAWPENLQRQAKTLFDGLLGLSADGSAALIEAARLDFQSRVNALSAATEEAHVERDIARSEYNRIEATNNILAAELRSSEETIRSHSAMIDDLVGQRSISAAQVLELERRLEYMREEHAVNVAALADSASTERTRLIDEMQAEQERAADERKHFMRQTDQLRQDHQAVAKEFKQKSLALENLLASTNRQLEQAGMAASQAKNEISTLQQTLNASKEQGALWKVELENSRRTELAAVGTIATQAAQLDLLQQRLATEITRVQNLEALLSVRLNSSDAGHGESKDPT